jgi:hypothetical protein
MKKCVLALVDARKDSNYGAGYWMMNPKTSYKTKLHMSEYQSVALGQDPIYFLYFVPQKYKVQKIQN